METILIVIGLVLLLCGGGAFFWASPKIDLLNRTQGATDFLGGDAQMQQMALSAQGVTPGDAALYHLVYGVGILAILIGVVLMVVGGIVSRRPKSA